MPARGSSNTDKYFKIFNHIQIFVSLQISSISIMLLFILEYNTV